MIAPFRGVNGYEFPNANGAMRSCLVNAIGGSLAAAWLVARRRRVCVRIAAIAVLMSAFPAHQALPVPPAETKPDELEKIKAALAEWTASIVNIHIRFNSTILDPDKSISRQTDWVRTDSGQEFRHTVLTIDGKVNHRTLYIWDKDRWHVANYPDGPSQFEEPLRVSTLPLESTGTSTVISPVFGLWDPKRKQWLSQILEEVPAEIAGSKLIDGVECPIVVFSALENLTSRLVLDPSHSYLPCEVNTAWHSEINEFRKVEPGVWLPWKGRFDTKAKGFFPEMWEVEVAEVNQLLKENLFQPPIALGTEVIDQFKGTSYIHGGVEQRDKLEAKWAVQAHRNLNGVQGDQKRAGHSGLPLSATPPVTNWWIYSWGAIFVAALVLTAVLVRTKLRR